MRGYRGTAFLTFKVAASARKLSTLAKGVGNSRAKRTTMRGNFSLHRDLTKRLLDSSLIFIAFQS